MINWKLYLLAKNSRTALRNRKLKITKKTLKKKLMIMKMVNRISYKIN